MNQRLATTVIAIGGLLLFIYLTPRLLEGGFGSLPIVLAVFGPIALGLVLRAEKYWPGMLIGAVNLPSILPSLPLVDVFTKPFMLFPAIILAAFLLKSAIYKETSPPSRYNRTEKILMVFCLLISLTWFLIRPPGSARLGAEQGGLGAALGYLLAPVMFLMVSSIGKKMDPQTYITNLKLAGWCSLIGFLYQANRGHLNYLGLLYARQMWVAMAALLAYEIYRSDKKNIVLGWRYILIAFTTVGLGAMAVHRSRPLFALLSVTAATLCHPGAVKRLGTIFLISALAIIPIVVTQPAWMPIEARRAMTIFGMTEKAKSEMEMGAETGWKSEFRARMLADAKDQIKRHPLGKGFGFDTSELLDVLFINESGSRESALSVIGGFHNAIVSYAKFVGVPAAFFFSYVIVAIFGRFIYTTRFKPMTGKKTWALFLIAATVPVLGHTLMNGGGNELMSLGITLGFMSSLWDDNPRTEEGNFLCRETGAGK